LKPWSAISSCYRRSIQWSNVILYGEYKLNKDWLFAKFEASV
jgi:hypothetical protein